MDPMSPINCVSYRLRRAARIMGRVYDDALSAHDLRNTQFTLLAALAIEGAKPHTELAESLGIETTTLTRNIDVLERRGLVRAVADLNDRRIRWVELTGEGRARYEAALESWRPTQEKVLKSLGTERWLETLSDLKRIEEV